MTIFNLKLQNTYFERGFFNVVVDYDRYVRKAEGPVRIKLGRNGIEINGKLDRKANLNGTARIYGSGPLKIWFQNNFEPMDIVTADLSSQDIIVLSKEQ